MAVSSENILEAKRQRHRLFPGGRGAFYPVGNLSSSGSPRNGPEVLGPTLLSKASLEILLGKLSRLEEAHQPG